jgi:radical SAM superfamily enzyme YgiQ (UPF0313 family)
LKILLIQPPIEDFYNTDMRLQPIGLCFIKASLVKECPDVDVEILDFHSGHGRQTLPYPKEFNYLKDYYGYHDKGPFSTFHQYFRFGCDYTKIAEEVKKRKPDLVGISSLFTPYYREVLKTAKAIKETSDTNILLGGSHISAFPEMMLANENVDYIIHGEGEQAMARFVKALQARTELSSIPGLGYKDKGNLVINHKRENYKLDELPIPDISDSDISKYQFEGKPLSFIITSRSCPHKCSFCSVHVTFGLNYSRRNPKLVMDEIKLRYEQGIRVFDFEDDNLSFYKKDMHYLLDEIEKSFPKKDVQFLAMNGISYLSLDREMLIKMRRVGFTHLNLALVSSDKSVLESTKRPHTVEKYCEIIKAGHELGFEMVSYQIIGLPDETLPSMMQTLSFNAALPVLMGASMYYRAPTFSTLDKDKELSEEDLFKARLTTMAGDSSLCSRDQIYTLFITTRIINFLKGLKLSDHSTLKNIYSLKVSNVTEERGILILKKLMAEKNLYACTPKGLELIKKFDSDLFFELLSKIDCIKTLDNKEIALGLCNPAMVN